MNNYLNVRDVLFNITDLVRSTQSHMMKLIFILFHNYRLRKRDYLLLYLI